MSRPNLLFIMTDHQRADSIGMVQAGREVTPNLNRLAAGSAFFSRAYNTCPLCVPARTALATGVYPTRNGVVYNDWPGRTAGDFLPLHQALAEAGYEVGHVGVHHIRLRPSLEERLDFELWVGEREYRDYLDARGLDAAPPEGMAAYKKHVAFPGREKGAFFSNTRAGVWPHPPEHFRDFFYARAGEEFLRRERERPFALFLYLWAPHPPLLAPEPYALMFAPDQLRLPPNVGVPPAGEPQGRRAAVPAALAEGVSQAEWRRAWAAHLGLVRLADDCIGRVLAALEGSGAHEETVTLFTVDHGEHLGQHALYQKMEMYEQAIRVPLLVRAPAGRRARFDAPVSHLDVMPTLLALLGLEEPGELDGICLRESALGRRPPPARTVFCQYSGSGAPGLRRRAAVTKRHKYVYEPETGLCELFDLAADPLEMENRAADPSLRAVRERLHAECTEWHAAHGDITWG